MPTDSDTTTGSERSGIVREPTIRDVVELPELQKGRPCQMYKGEEPIKCDEPSEFLFVYDANTDPDDDRRKNCLCCSDCKPRAVATEEA